MRFISFLFLFFFLACTPQQEKKPQNSPTKTAKKENLPAKTENGDTLMTRIEGKWEATFAQTESGNPLPCEGHYLSIKQGNVTFYRADGQVTTHLFYWDESENCYASNATSRIIVWRKDRRLSVFTHGNFHGLSMDYSRINQ